MEALVGTALGAIIGTTLGLIVLALLGFVLKILWNSTLPDLFGFKAIRPGKPSNCCLSHR
jgi:hypothetical protein